MKKTIACLAVLLSTIAALRAQTKAPVIVNTTTIVAPIQPTMWGIFFEDINMGADGGIYAELVKNRSFEFYTPMMGWNVLPKQVKEGALLVLNRGEANAANPRYLHVNARQVVKGGLGLVNEGFRGMGIKQGETYHFSVQYRQPAGAVKMHIELLNARSAIIGSALLVPEKSGDQWNKQAVDITATGTDAKGKMAIWFEGDGTLDLDMISLFPQTTWKQRPGGMRADLVQLLADLKPGFVRFPGGCIVEGYSLDGRYQWKKTIGPVEDRHLIVNRWNTEFAHRLTPDYYQTFGLGFLEYFQLAEDIGAEPLPILNCGMACQFNSAEVVPVDQLDPYVQDALDLIEFANGDVNTTWGKVRASLGHPAPFNMKMMGVGNENWGPQYLERLRVFSKAIKTKYPNIKLVNSSGTDPDTERFYYLDTALRAMKADIIDEHYYRRPEWFLQNAKRYDTYDRDGSKIFAGEYAAQSDRVVSVNNKNNWRSAIAEAAFMTGLERNADVVYMASYAPLFAHVDGWQWTPDLIWFDNLRSYGTPNYYVQKLFSVNKGTHLLKALQNKEPLTGQDSLYATACLDKNTNEVIVKLINTSAVAQTREIVLEGAKKLAKTGTLTELKSTDPEQVNSLDQPTALGPVEKTIAVKGKNIQLTAAPFSFTILRVKMN